MLSWGGPPFLKLPLFNRVFKFFVPNLHSFFIELIRFFFNLINLSCRAKLKKKLQEHAKRFIFEYAPTMLLWGSPLTSTISDNANDDFKTENFPSTEVHRFFYPWKESALTLSRWGPIHLPFQLLSSLGNEHLSFNFGTEPFTLIILVGISV